MGALGRSTREQSAALGVIGTCASNNVKFQEDLLKFEPTIIQILVQVPYAQRKYSKHANFEILAETGVMIFGACVCIFLQHYHIHNDIGNSTKYLRFKVHLNWNQSTA